MPIASVVSGNFKKNKNMNFESNEELIEFLAINIKEKDAIDKIFKIIIDYLSIFRNIEFNYVVTVPFNGIMNKYINCAKYLGAETASLRQSIENLNDILNKNKTAYFKYPLYSRILFPKAVHQGNISYRNEVLKPKESAFSEIYNQVVLVYNSIKDLSSERSEIELGGFYNPDISNRNYAKKLINEAIDIITNDDILSEATKKSIIDYLTNALIEFEKPNSNWSIIFGKLKETIFVLGALGSLAGGITGVISLNDAKLKLEEATEVIEKTSININYSNINQLFKIGNTILIQNNQPTLILEEKTYNDEVIETTINN
jgi:hypothetical protein